MRCLAQLSHWKKKSLNKYHFACYHGYCTIYSANFFTFRWVATHLAPRSGAATLEVDIPTGYVVWKPDLRKYQRVSRIQSQRSRFTSQKVVLYFDYVSSKLTINALAATLYPHLSDAPYNALP